MKKQVQIILLLIFSNLSTLHAIDTTKDIGEIAMQQEVSDNGTLGYTVPIEVYPGRNGLQPSLGLAYNSMGGNGVLGMGWNIGGPSLISVANKTLHFDGKVETAKLNSSSAYTLDGMRLLIFGTDSNILKPQQGDIIVQNKIYYFEAFYPDGKKAVYGFKNNTINKPFYPLTRLEDNLGNYIEYEYIEDNNQYYVSKIKYGANSIANSEHFAFVNYYYNSRNDVIPVYIDGLCIKQTKLLVKLETYFQTQLLKTYDFNHELRNNHFLTQINCIANGKSLNPLVFEYGTGERSNIQKTRITNDGLKSFTGLAKFDITSAYTGVVIAGESHNSNYAVLKSDKNGIQYGSNYNNNSRGAIVYPKGTSGYSTRIPHNENFQALLSLDFDGDGNDELIKINNASAESAAVVNIQTYKYSKSDDKRDPFTREAFTISTSSEDITIKKYKSPEWRTYLTGDFDGDGREELLIIAYGKNAKGESRNTNATYVDIKEKKVKANNTLFFKIEPLDRLYVIDFDGDGKADLAHITVSGTLFVYSLNISNRSYQQLTWRNLAFAQDARSIGFQFVDMNGDGKTDLVASPRESIKSKRYVHQGSCAGCCSMMATSPEELERSNDFPVPMQCGPSQKCVISGVESYYTMDGGSKWTVYYSDGKTYSNEQNLTIGRYDRGYPFSIQDINRDGLPDLIRVNDNNYISFHLNKNGVFNVHPYYTDKDFCVDQGIYRIANGDVLKPTSLYNEVVFANQYLTTFKESIDESSQNLLTKSTNSLGIITNHTYALLYDTAVYKPSATVISPYSYPNISLGGKLYLPQTTKTYNGTTLIGSNKYTFGNGIVHRQGLGFRGFTEVIITDSIRNITITKTFRPHNFGVLRSVESPSSRILYGYDIWTRVDKTTRIQLVSKVEYDKLKDIELMSLYEYDDYKNPTKFTLRQGNTVLSTTTNAYKNNTNYTAEPYMLGLLTGQTVINNRGTESVTLKSTIGYNAKGQATSKASYYNGNLSIEETFSYDSNTGNLLETKAKPYTSTNWQATKYSYDIYGRVVQEIDPLGLAVTYGYTAKGLLAFAKDHKGNQTKYEYDVWGRKTKTTFADGAIEIIGFSWVSAPVGAVIRSTVTSNYKPETQVFMDALGRKVREGTKCFDNKYLYVDYLYNNRGRLQKSSLPFKGTAAERWNTYYYDVYNRVTSVKHASGKEDKYEYDKNTVKSTISGVTKTTAYDVTGQIATITDPAGIITYNLRADNQPKSVVAPGNITTTFEYDAYGRQTKIIDPSAGTKSFAYDVAGNISQETDANNKVTKFTYDAYNRLTKKEVVALQTTGYTYNTDGMLTAATCNNNTATAYTYDNLLRVKTVKESIIDGKWLQKEYAYTNGVVSSIAYASNAGAITSENYIYAYGNLSEIKLNNTTSIWKLSAENNMGQTTQSTAGGLTRNYTYDIYGLPTKRDIKYGASFIQNFSCDFNRATGNLTYRKDNNRNIQENFTYDNLNRLKTFNGKTITYDVKGNITDYTTVGKFEYGLATKPYAVTKVTPYAPATNIAEREQTVTYNGMMRPETITENGYTAAFNYNADGDRVKMQIKKGTVTELTRYYIANQYEADLGTAGEKQRLYLGGTAYSANAVYVKEGTGVWTLYYIARDHLGSITHVINTAGTIKQELNYDPWGRLRNPVNQTLYSFDAQPPLFLGRGFTGHEHLPQFGLINMNARLYDPVLGRFLSPDPYVQAPDFSQSFNRYSYCMNNPLIYTDENGEFWHIVAGALIGGVVNWAANGAQFSTKGLGHFGVGAAAGALGAFTGGAAAGALGQAQTFGAAVLYSGASGAAGGFSSGFVIGAGNSWVSGNNFSQGMVSGFKGGGIGAASGAIAGGVIGGIRFQKQMHLFQKGNSTLGYGVDDAVPATDAFLKDAQKAWYPDAPMEYVDNFSVENVPTEYINRMEKVGARGMAYAHRLNGRITGRSDVFFHKNAFTSTKQLFFTMGHEFVHVSQHVALAGVSVRIYENPLFIDMMEFHAYSYEGRLGNPPTGLYPYDIKRMMTTYPKQFNNLSPINYSWTFNYLKPF